MTFVFTNVNVPSECINHPVANYRNGLARTGAGQANRAFRDSYTTRCHAGPERIVSGRRRSVGGASR